MKILLLLFLQNVIWTLLNKDVEIYKALKTKEQIPVSNKNSDRRMYSVKIKLPRYIAIQGDKKTKLYVEKILKENDRLMQQVIKTVDIKDITTVETAFKRILFIYTSNIFGKIHKVNAIILSMAENSPLTEKTTMINVFNYILENNDGRRENQSVSINMTNSLVIKMASLDEFSKIISNIVFSQYLEVDVSILRLIAYKTSGRIYVTPDLLYDEK